MFMKSYLKTKTPLTNYLRKFSSTAQKAAPVKDLSSISSRFHQMYVQELDRIQSSAYEKNNI
jgi:hypothetical protein